MKKTTVLIILLVSFLLTAMSDSPKEELKSGNGFITQNELQRIAINYYKFIFEEEHEFKNWSRKGDEKIIKNITPITEENVTVAYIVNYNPDGHVLIKSSKNLGNPIYSNGSGIWTSGVEEGFLKTTDKRLDPMNRSWFHSLKEALDSGSILTKDKDLEIWSKFNVPVENFNERANFDSQYPPPKWWIEKKNSKNTQGMIQTEWHQNYSFNKLCPRYTDTLTVVGCTPLAMAQLMRHYQWPNSGLNENSYDWFNGYSTLSLSENFYNKTYNWLNMPAYVDSLSQQSDICRDAGISVNADYGIRATSVIFDEVASGFSKHFNYTAQLKSKADWFSTSDTVEWMDSLKYQILDDKPIIYGGLFTDGSFSGMHTWIVDGNRNISGEQFHFNMGWQDTTLNDWYGTDKILTSHYAVFNLIPDTEADAMTMPYKQNFDSVMTGGSVKQIPINMGVSKYDAFYVESLGDNNALYSNNLVDLKQDWFLIKKIDLSCDSVPIFQFRFKTIINNMSGNDSITVEISNDNRLTWDLLSVIDETSYESTTEIHDKIITLNEYKNDIVNLRIKFNHTRNDLMYFIDSLKVYDSKLEYTELTNNMKLQPSDNQSVKVTPSIVTSPKSKGFEDYDMMVDFYIKEDVVDSSYVKVFTDSTLENGIFEYPNWDTNDLLDKTFLIRAVARTKSDSTTLTSTEVRVVIAGRQCHVDLPLPATESWFDFETRLNFEGSILAEPAFVDSLDNVLIGFDVYDDYWSQVYTDAYGYEINISIFSSLYTDNYLCDSTAYICDFGKDKQQLEGRPEKLIELENNYDTSSMKYIEANKGTKDLESYPAFTSRYPRSLDLYPGTFTVYMQAIRKDLYEYDGTISEIARHDSMQFIIPQWKMKFLKDYWFEEKVPYTPIKEYQKTKIMKLTLWRPWYMAPYNPLYLDVIRETDSTIVQNYEIDFNTKASFDDIGWDIPEATVPGFYNLKANNVDYSTDIEVIQETLTQVCPLYLSWENDGAWPANWPGGETTADWEIYTSPLTPTLGEYSLAAKYNTNAPGQAILERENLSIEGEWDRLLEFAIGLPKSVGVSNFDELLANYSIATTKDGANWTIEKTPKVEEYNIHTWGVDTAYCFIKTYKPLGKITNLGIKFITTGITSLPANTQQMVLFDEVKVDYTKEPAKAAPNNYQNNFADGNVNVDWGAPAKTTKDIDLYYVYRNGFKIGETTEITYVDTTVEADTYYNYSVTAHYNDGSLFPESPMLDCSGSIFTGLYSPSNLIITNENPDIKLVWEPVTGASSYKVYSSADPYGTFTEDTTGTFNGEEWIAPLSLDKLFYYVVATDVGKVNNKIIKDTDYRVK